jgi:tetratricopeptide (TPR) repeat protein
MTGHGRRSSWVRRMGRLLAFPVRWLFFDLLNNWSMVEDRIRDRPSQRRRGGRFLMRVAASLLPLRVLMAGVRWLASGRAVQRVAALPSHVTRFAWSRVLEFVDSLGLLNDGIEQRKGWLARATASLRTSWRLLVGLGSVGRTVFLYLVYEPFYHLGLVSDGVDAQRIWTGRTTACILPVVIGGAAVVVFGICIQGTSPQTLKARYLQAARDAEQSRDYVAEMLFLERLLELDPQLHVVRYHLALAAEARGDAPRAEGLMSQLAPTNRTGLPAAHLWLARRLLSHPSLTLSEVTQAWAHLQRVVRHSPQDSEIHYLLSKIVLAVGRMEDAELHLAHAGEQRPEAWIVLAYLHHVRGQTAQARQEATKACRALKPQLEGRPDDIDLRLQLAEGQRLAEDFPAAEATLLPGLLGAEVRAFEQALGQLYVTWSQATTGTTAEALVQRRALLLRALKIDPWDIPALARLAELRRPSSAEAKWAGEVLGRLNWHQATASAHLVIGVDDWECERPREAREHLEAAYRLEPQRADVVNNLAWFLAHSEPTDLPRALRLVDAGLATAPGNPHLLDTRGQILAGLDRYEEAADVLEQAAVDKHGDQQLHRTLADCYAKLGLTHLADFQRRLALEAGQATAHAPSVSGVP